MKNLFKRKPRRTLSEVSAEFAKKVPLPPKNTIERKREMTRAELLNQVAEKLERCEYTPIVTTKEEYLFGRCCLIKFMKKPLKQNRNEGCNETRLDLLFLRE